MRKTNFVAVLKIYFLMRKSTEGFLINYMKFVVLQTQLFTLEAFWEVHGDGKRSPRKIK